MATTESEDYSLVDNVQSDVSWYLGLSYTDFFRAVNDRIHKSGIASPGRIRGKDGRLLSKKYASL